MQLVEAFTNGRQAGWADRGSRLQQVSQDGSVTRLAYIRALDRNRIPAL